MFNKTITSIINRTPQGKKSSYGIMSKYDEKFKDDLWEELLLPMEIQEEIEPVFLADYGEEYTELKSVYVYFKREERIYSLIYCTIEYDSERDFEYEDVVVSPLYGFAI